MQSIALVFLCVGAGASLAACDKPAPPSATVDSLKSQPAVADTDAASGSIPTDVETVITGGYWKQADDAGAYRAIIHTGGFDHVISTLTIEWLKEPREEGADTKIVATQDIALGSVRLYDPVFAPAGSDQHLTVRFADTHASPIREGVRHVKLGRPGVATADSL